jgi:CRISPR-associated protein Cas1
MQAHDTPPLLDGRRGVVREPHTCLQCGEQFIPKRQTRGMFCSRACYWKWWPAHRAEEVARQGRDTLERLKDEGQDPRAAPQAAWKRRASFRHTAVSAFEDESGDDELWAERGRYWSDQTDPEAEEPTFYRRQERKPLVLVGHGLRLRIHRGSLVVTHGFTHYPQNGREQRFFAGDPKLPSRIVLLSADGSISLDVVRWLSEQRVQLVMLDYRGQVVSVLGTETTAADLELRRAQIAALTDGRGLALASTLIERKLSASLDTLAALPASVAQESAIDRVASLMRRLRDDPPRTIGDLRLLEAWAAISYFAAWRTIPLRWKGTGKKPIPPEWRWVGMRQDALRRSNRHARHPVNAMLNYGYAVLETQVRIAIAEAGLDPSIGYLHVCQPGRQSLVHDLMEPYRPEVDREVLEITRSETFTPGDFVIDTKGVCRLHPELARHVAGRSTWSVNADSMLARFRVP